MHLILTATWKQPLDETVYELRIRSAAHLQQTWFDLFNRN